MSSDAGVTWDYTTLAEHYDDRAPYAEALTDLVRDQTGLTPGAAACDMGAGTGAMTRHLLQLKLSVVAVEPNRAMRRHGEARLAGTPVRWVPRTAEDSELPSNAFSLVSFGSSFNVTDRARALAEAWRLLDDHGWLLLAWNHRDLSDPVQAGIENIIREWVPGYGLGTRREEQLPVLRESGLFTAIRRFELPVLHELPRRRFSRAWRSHATLQRQAGDRFEHVLEAIDEFLERSTGPMVTVPYVTRIYLARRGP